MSLPNLNPAIRSVQVYDENGNLVSQTGFVQPNQKVRVVCKVYNNNASSNGEQFDMHFLMDSVYTKNLSPLADSAANPIKVNGVRKTGASLTGVDSATGKTGVPFVLKGTNNVNSTADDTTIEYWATVNQSNGAAVTVGQTVVDDMFGGTASLHRTLLEVKPITPAPGNPDPDNPPAGAGTQYHYLRYPAANANGWNNEPVSVRFYPGAVTSGGFSQMTVTANGAALPEATLSATNPTWTRLADTANYALTLKGSDPATGIASQTASETVRIDTSPPTLSFDADTGVLTVSDVPTDSSKATSGVWKLYRTSGTTRAGETLVQTYGLTNGVGAATQTQANLSNGTYVAEDAAGNRSAPLRVSAVQPPSAERPPESLPGGEKDPVGPVLGDDDPVPEPEFTDGDDGTTYAVINETVTQVAQPDGSLFGGDFDAADAEALMDYRYAFSTAVAGGLTQTTELLAADGSALAGGSLPTTKAGSCLVRRVVTDAQGNTTTVNLTYRLVDPVFPQVFPGGSGTDPEGPDEPTGGNPGGPGAPTDPDDPAAPEPVQPDGEPTVDPDGTQHARVSLEVTEGTSAGLLTEPGALALLTRHYTPANADGTAPSVELVSMASLPDEAVTSRIDLSQPGDYRLVYRLSDADGNTTTATLTYHLVASKAPWVVPEPEDGEPAPTTPPLVPVEPTYVDGAGHHHAVVDDALTESVEPGAVLGAAEVRALVEGRYAFLSAIADEDAAFEGMAISDASGKTVASIDKSLPATYTVRYKVADAEGNTTLLRLRYTLVDESKPTPDDPPGPSEPDTPPAPDKPVPDEPTVPGPPTVTVVDPDAPGPVRPLTPTSTTRDEAGLQHSVIEDTIIVGTRNAVMKPTDFAALFAKRYAVASTLPDGEVRAGAVALFDDEGVPIASVDRSQAGVYHAEQLYTDSAGNTTLLRVVYEVRDEYVKTDLPASGSNDTGSGGGGAGSASRAGETDATRVLHELAQTSDWLGGCPLHPLFVLLMVLASAYGLMKLRLEGLARRRLLRTRHEAAAAMRSPAGTLVALTWSFNPADLAYEVSWPGSASLASEPDKARTLGWGDGLLFLLVTAAALVIAANGLCPFDWLWAGAVALVCAFWLVLLARKIRATNRKLSDRA